MVEKLFCLITRKSGQDMKRFFMVGYVPFIEDREQFVKMTIPIIMNVPKERLYTRKNLIYNIQSDFGNPYTSLIRMHESEHTSS